MATARQLTALIQRSQSLEALEKLLERHGSSMDRLHVSALLHRCGQLSEAPQGLATLLSRLSRPSSREAASALWALARCRRAEEASSFAQESLLQKQEATSKTSSESKRMYTISNI